MIAPAVQPVDARTHLADFVDSLAVRMEERASAGEPVAHIAADWHHTALLLRQEAIPLLTGRW